jgi:hypothetical protein
MLDNQFVYEIPAQFFNMAYLKLLVRQLQFERVQGLAKHHRRVADDPYLLSLQQRIPVLSDLFNIYTLEPGKGLPIHTDANRQCALNIPISGTEQSITSFYSSASNTTSVYNEKLIVNEITSHVVPVFSYTLAVPSLIDNSIPHSVQVYGTVPRITISWSIRDGVTMTEAKEAFIKALGNV